MAFHAHRPIFLATENIRRGIDGRWLFCPYEPDREYRLKRAKWAGREVVVWAGSKVQVRGRGEAAR